MPLSPEEERALEQIAQAMFGLEPQAEDATPVQEDDLNLEAGDNEAATLSDSAVAEKVAEIARARSVEPSDSERAVWARRQRRLGRRAIRLRES